MPACFPHATYDLVVIAASAGGLSALREILPAVPPAFPAPIVVVQHISASFPTQIAALWRSWTQLNVRFAIDRDRLRAGTVYIAPPDRHLLVGFNRRLLLSRSDKLHYVRPAADPLFESAAAAFDRVLGIVLTGMDWDGATGAQSIKRAGGTVIAQDPATAEAYAMPTAVIERRAADFVLPLRAIASALVSLVMAPGGAALFGRARSAA